MMMTLVKPKQMEEDQSNVLWIMFVLKMKKENALVHPVGITLCVPLNFVNH